MQQENKQINNTEIHSIQKPKFPIFLKLFFSFFLFSIFIITAVSLLAFWTLQNTDLMASKEDLQELYTNFKNNFIFLVILVIIPGIYLSIQLAEDITHPIRLITKNIKEISQGNLNLNIETNRKDEFGNIIRLFNEMIIKLKEVKARNEEISQMKSNFITVASHQLRTPVSGVRWGLDALASELKGPINKDQKEIIDKCIERNNETIRNIDDLLDTSQIEENNFPYEMQEVNISKITENVVKEFEAESKIKNKKIVFENKLDKEFKIVADPKRMNLVISNIIENAINYSTKDTDIEVSIQTEGEYILIQIENYGIGIKKEDEGKIFAKFYRAENAILTKPNGIGLGLYICKKIVEYHKGKIVVFSSPDTSKTIFSIYLPIPNSLITEKPHIEEFLENI
ncbi:MAG: HAMP domain-containing sensor histidine kinase [Candidatus Paceibacterota bacterium]